MNYAEANFKDLYEILHISRDTSIEEIKKLRKTYGKKYHPDLAKDIDQQVVYTQLLAEINDAIDVLTDPVQRAEYDRLYDQVKRKEAERKRQQEQARCEESWYEYDFRSKQSQQQSAQEDTWYDYGFEGQRREQYSQRRTTAGQEDNRKRTTSGKHAKYSKKSSFFGDIKQAYKEVLEDEKKARKGAARAHKNVEDLFKEKFGEPESVPEKIIINISKGTLHIFVSTVRELSKIRYITKDSVPKFVIRTRRGVATGLAAIIIFSGLGNLGNKTPETPTTDTSITMETPTEETTVADSDLNIMFDEETKNTTCTINRTHTVRSGETLSGIAEETGISMSTIQRVNEIKSANLIRVGDKLIIPYTYNTEDIDYFTEVVNVQTGTTVKTIAELYNTDVATIVSLNGDAIVQEDNKYYIISNTIIVPNFATQKEVQAAKAADEAYTKHQ